MVSSMSGGRRLILFSILFGMYDERFESMLPVYRYRYDSFSPVTDFAVAKLILRLCMQNGWKRMHIDFKNAFPNKEPKFELPSEFAVQ